MLSYATVDEGRTFQRLENGIPSCETNKDTSGVLKRALLEWETIRATPLILATDVQD